MILVQLEELRVARALCLGHAPAKLADLLTRAPAAFLNLDAAVGGASELAVGLIELALRDGGVLPDETLAVLAARDHHPERGVVFLLRLVGLLEHPQLVLQLGWGPGWRPSPLLVHRSKWHGQAGWLLHPKLWTPPQARPAPP